MKGYLVIYAHKHSFKHYFFVFKVFQYQTYVQGSVNPKLLIQAFIF